MSNIHDRYADIAAVVEANRTEIERDLVAAEAALAAAEAAQDGAIADVSEAERQVAQFRNLLAIANGMASDPPTMPEASMTLHDAMREVLKTAPNRRMLAADIAEAIDRRGLYKMRDGRAVEKQQVHARVGHYPSMFERDGNGGIRLL